MVSFEPVGSFWFFISLPCGRFSENFQPFFSTFYGTGVEIREHVNQQVQRSLRGEKSDLRLSSYYQWTNIVIESCSVPTNHAFRWPYEAQVVLFAQGTESNTGAPLERHVAFEISYMDEDNWFFLPKQTIPRAEKAPF